METTPRIGIGEVAKRLVLGHAIASSKAEHQLLPKVLTLPVFSFDAYIKRLLLLEPGVVVASVPYHLDERPGSEMASAET
ncbi:MAG: hypothetical protein M3P43_13695 [Actinomycetota bacterium]|nr:hypothetical protein [Actinomycetota bacterium]